MRDELHDTSEAAPVSESATPDQAFDADIEGLPYSAGPAESSARDEVEQLLSEFIERQRRGEEPTIDEYKRQYPHLGPKIEELFPMVAAMEYWKQRKESHILRERLSHEFDFEQIGRCRVRRKLAYGGMGVVFEAYHEEFQRRVAVKLLPWRFSAVSDNRRRFQREARTASTLHHPNIVRVLEYGEWDGFCYYVMPFIDGVGLERVIEKLARTEQPVAITHLIEESRQAAEGPSDTADSSRRRRGSKAGILALWRNAWPQFAQIGLQVAEGLRYAHAQGVLHRDIKPSNILIDKRGKIWITDFGLAESVDLQAQNPSQIDLSGTARYMAPERFLGQSDKRGDLYSLGVTLYELATLQPAFPAAHLRGKSASLQPPLLRFPRRVNNAIPKELESIIAKAVIREPHRRYQSAADLATDLLRYLHSQPVDAPRIRWWQRLFSGGI